MVTMRLCRGDYSGCSVDGTPTRVSYTDLGLLGEINADKCTVRLLPLVEGEVGRGALKITLVVVWYRAIAGSIVDTSNTHKEK